MKGKNETDKDFGKLEKTLQLHVVRPRNGEINKRKRGGTGK